MQIIPSHPYATYMSNELQRDLQWIPIHNLHNHTVPVAIHWSWHWESPIIEGLHVSKLFGSRQPRQVDPRGLISVMMVVALFLQFAERSSPKSEKMCGKLY